MWISEKINSFLVCFFWKYSYEKADVAQLARAADL